MDYIEIKACSDGELIKVKARHILDPNTKRSAIATHSQHIHKGDAV